ncbi:MAG TPA: acylphosphatase [Caulobacteraceae bacterium]|nr:acylphosphatase [Caulobacteraceae bacterium]
MERRAFRLTVRGRVQGVGYRWWASDEARRLGIDGWVRNRRDGSVEILAIGAEEAVQRLIEACRRGPPAAAVNSVECADADDDGSAGFYDRPTV